MITVNSLLLGGSISFFQSVCVLGYCIFPLLVATLATLLWHNIIYRTAVVVACDAWATLASLRFLGDCVPPNRKLLAIYPVFLFYISIGWLILIQ